MAQDDGARTRDKATYGAMLSTVSVEGVPSD